MTLTTSTPDPKTLGPHRVHNPDWSDRTPATYACIFAHLETIAEQHRKLGAAAMDLRGRIAGEVVTKGAASPALLSEAESMGCYLCSEDLEDNSAPPADLMRLAQANDDLYLDAQRLSGKLVYDGDGWRDADEVARRATHRGNSVA